jgi:acyl carrier protein
MIQTSLEDVKTVLKKSLSLEGIDIDSLDGSEPLFESLGLDSLDAIELVVILKKNYDITIENMTDGREIFQTLNTFRTHIQENRKK